MPCKINSASGFWPDQKEREFAQRLGINCSHQKISINSPRMGTLAAPPSSRRGHLRSEPIRMPKVKDGRQTVFARHVVLFFRLREAICLPIMTSRRFEDAGTDSKPLDRAQLIPMFVLVVDVSQKISLIPTNWQRVPCVVSDQSNHPSSRNHNRLLFHNTYRRHGICFTRPAYPTIVFWLG